MRIKLVSVESGINAIGFRRIAAVARHLDPTVDICFIPIDNLLSIFSKMFPDDRQQLNDEDVLHIAHYLAKSDIVGFSSMTIASKYVEKICTLIRQFNPKCKLIWGGSHPTLYSEEALKFVDEVCIGEGETYIKRLLAIVNKIQHITIGEKEQLHSYQGFDCNIYDSKRKEFRQLTMKDYVIYNGVLFRTMWTIGCPYSCAYCANDALGKIDKNYKKLRYPSVEWIINEIELAVKTYPIITTIAFDDDNFISLPLDIIKEFCFEWKKRINKPFVIYGMHPNTVTEEKVELLARAGMNRCRMGIQSGSKYTLKLLNRNTTVEQIKKSANILTRVAKTFNMIPPAFDIITDIPKMRDIEKHQTLNLLYNIKRPFTLTIFSLRVFPKTALYDKFVTSDTHYLKTQKNLYNTRLYLLGIFHPENWLIKIVKAKHYNLIKTIYHIKRGMDHIIRGDFSRINGEWRYWIWKLTQKILRNK